MSEAIEYFLPPLGGPSDSAVAEARSVLSMREDAVKEQNKNILVTCTSQTATGKGCGARHRVGDLQYIQTHWYTPPHGCTSGDYWNHGEGMFRCPSCGHLNRLYATKKIQEIKRFFASVKDEYK